MKFLRHTNVIQFLTERRGPVVSIPGSYSGYKIGPETGYPNWYA
jgi:hypothetical protein